MFNYIPEFFKGETADNIDDAERWYADKKNNRRTPDLLPRDEVARAINAEVKAGRGSPHGGVFLDIASRRSPDYIRKRLPSMYHQFRELADVDITRESMEVGPTCHYIMGGIRVNADTTATCVPGLFAAGEVAGGRDFNPAWHLALDLYSMLSVSEAVTLGALERKESRGGHTRDDYPLADDHFGKVNVVIRRKGGAFSVAQEPLPEMPDDLKE